MEYTPEEEAYLQQQAALQRQQAPPGKDSEFLQWLFNLKKQTLEPLVHAWRGEIEVQPGIWELPKREEDRLPLMNEKGIMWSSSLIGGYLNPVFIITNYDEEQMYWVMKHMGKNVWDGLSQNYVEYSLDKINIPRVANEIIHKVHAILLGARANGYREFFSKTHQVSEVRSTSVSQQQAPPRRGLTGIFKRPAPPIEELEGY